VIWQTLDRHPRVTAFGEMFLDGLAHPASFATYLRASPLRRLALRVAPRRTTARYLSHLLRPRADADAVGFKLMYSQVRPERWDWLVAHDVRFVHLVRSPLAILVSKAAVERTGVRHVPRGAAAPRARVRLETADLLPALRRVAGTVEDHRRRLAGLPHLEVRYEELVDDRERFFGALFAFLGVAPVALPAPPLEKIVPDAADALENADEVAAALAGTEFGGDVPATRRG
jgi:hypothetical protein